MKNNIIGLGNIVRDSVTGFKGCIFVRACHLNGCLQYHVVKRYKNNDPKIMSGEASVGSFDVARLEYVSKGSGLLGNAEDYIWPVDGPNLGDEVENFVTGVKGQVIVTYVYITGEKTCCIQPKCNSNGDLPDAQELNTKYLAVIKKAKKVKAAVNVETPVTAEAPGFVSNAPRLVFR